MKLKLLLATLLAAAITTGCSDPPSSAHYIYKNNTSQNITVKAYTLSYPDNIPIFQMGLTIAPGAEHSMYFDGFIGIPEPFDLGNNTSGFLTFSNEEKQITQWKGDGLWNTENYQVLNKKDYSASYRYVFTDKDFEVNQTGRSVYHYKNDSDYEITLQLYHIKNGTPELDLDVTIEKLRTLRFENDKGFIPAPFTINGTICASSYLMISNREKEITQHYQSTELNLFDMEYYEKLTKEPYEEGYQYIFTNADFDNAEPIDN